MNHILSKVLLLLLLFSGYGIAFAQRDQVWIFGDSAGVSFSTVPPTAIASKIVSYEGCASICDPGGQLLFYTDGNKVWNRSNQIMPNGTALITDITYPDFGPTSSTAQGSLIVPVPDQPQRYYIFSLTSIELGSNRGRLYYSIVDMSLAGGQGDVIAAGKGTLIDSLNTEHLTGVVGERCNLWILTLSMSNATTEHIKAFEITSAGVQTVPVVSTFTIPFSPGSSFGQMDVSPDRRKLALSRAIPFASIGGALELFDFDPATGIASNQRALNDAGFYSVCFSPDNSKLYANATTTAGIDQYDLSLGTTAAIIGSRTFIGAIQAAAIRRAPDGQLYCGGAGALSVIRHPNVAGTASLLVPNAIPLLPNTNVRSGLPNLIPEIHHDTAYQSQDSKAACFSTSHILTARDTTGWDYQWSQGGAAHSTTVTSPGTYWVGYHMPPCAWHVDTFKVTFDGQRPQLFATAGCRNDSNAFVRAVPAAGDTTTYTYTWLNSANQVIRGPLLTRTGDTLPHITTGSYTLQVKTSGACSTSISIGVPPPSPYRAAFSTSDTLICMGGVISFTNASSEDMATYSWQFGDGSTSALKDPVHPYPHHGIYQVKLIAGTAYPCYDTATGTIIVDSIKQGSFWSSRDSICTGEAILFTPLMDSTVAYLSWQFGEADHMQTPYEPVQHAFDQDGLYPVRLVFHPRACPDTSFTKAIRVYPLPKVDLGPDSVLCLDGAPLQLAPAGPAPAGPHRRVWSTGDTAAILNVVHPGRYSLTVSLDPMGCSTTESVEVHKDCYIDIPNAFTPNADGVNDYFFPRQLLSRKVTRFNMQLFNRWGQVVFDTRQTNGRGWDGRFNGKEQPQGVYLYQIDMEIDGRRQEHYQGNVTLIR